jgi:biotin synthase
MIRAGNKQTYEFLRALTDRIISGGMIAREEACRIAALHTHEEVVMLICHAAMLRNCFKGVQIELCAIVNAKSGRCTEDCAFCAQSARYPTEVQSYPLLEAAAVIDRAREAERSGAVRFGIVTSGRGMGGGNELAGVCASIEGIRSETRLMPCASLGMVGEKQMRRLREAGLQRYHHNLETAASHFPLVCSSHAYQERLDTIHAAKQAGMEVCVGGILGLGESPRQRVELALALRALDIDSVPLNFLNPIRGTPAERYPLLTPLEILTIIALFRFVLPGKDIRVCGGRETGLRTLQPLMYLAGANATMTGNYLTTGGRSPDIDGKEIEDLGLNVLSPDDLSVDQEAEERRSQLVNGTGQEGGSRHPG